MAIKKLTIPWQEKPKDCKDVMWRYDANPIINRYDIPTSNSIFNSAVLPNQCKKCEVINVKTGISLFTNEGCGGENTRLEENAQIEAYLLSRNSSNLCDLEVRCTTWRKNPEAEN